MRPSPFKGCVSSCCRHPLNDLACCAGRAGNKGTAITFIAPEDDRYAPDLVKALKESAAPIPKDLQAGLLLTTKLAPHKGDLLDAADLHRTLWWLRC